MNTAATVMSTGGVNSLVIALATSGCTCFVRTLTVSAVAGFPPGRLLAEVPVAGSGAGAGGTPTRIGGPAGSSGMFTVCDWSTP